MKSKLQSTSILAIYESQHRHLTYHYKFSGLIKWSFTELEFVIEIHYSLLIKKY